MNLKIRFTRKLDEMVRKDLQRPHEFAHERIGFISSRHTVIDNTSMLILLTEYHPIDDKDYVKDRTVGARINGNAIRKAMQNVLDTKEGMFHVHIHAFDALPEMSRVDRDGIPPVVENFGNVDGTAIHGILLMSTRQYKAYVRIPTHSKLVMTTNISVVGFPLSLNI